jgi:predicted RNA-binding Zn ribbon-like protein
MRSRRVPSRSAKNSGKKEGSAAVDDLAIRFVNTAAWRLREPREERLPDVASLLAWAATNGVATPASLKALPVDRRRGDRLYADAIALRESVYEILAARAHGKPPPRRALTSFNGFFKQAMPGMSLGWRPGKLLWELSPDANGDDLLKPIVVSAAALMTGINADRVKQCQDDRGCGWLFVDDSRAQNRRWCSMGDCGNRAKARRHYQRARL